LFGGNNPYTPERAAADDAQAEMNLVERDQA